MSISKARNALEHALLEWKDAGGSVQEVTDYIEGLISAKVDEILQAKADVAGLLPQQHKGTTP